MRVIPTTSIADFSTAIKKAGAKQIERKAEQYGKMLVADLDARVNQIPTVNAAAKKHGTPGSVHNVTFTHVVKGQADSFPIYLSAKANGSSGDIMKMWLLNNGRPGGVVIRPTSKKWLKFEWGHGDESTTYAKQVSQGSMEGLHFIEDAVARLPFAVARRFRRRR